VAFGAFEGKAHRGHRVRRSQHLKPLAAEHQAVAQLERHERQRWGFEARQPGEVGPDDAVEDVGAQRVECCRQRMNLDGTATGGQAAAHHGVGQQADGQHVVQVRMAHQDVVDQGKLVEREIAHARSSVDQHVVINEESSGSAASGNGAGATENADFHASEEKSRLLSRGAHEGGSLNRSFENIPPMLTPTAP